MEDKGRIYRANKAAYEAISDILLKALGDSNNESDRLSFEEIIELGHIITMEYKKLLMYEYDDLSTKDLEKVKERFLTRTFADGNTVLINAYTKNKKIRRLLRLPLNILFEALKIGNQKQSLVEKLSLEKHPTLYKIRREIRDRGKIPHVFENAKLSEVLWAIQNSLFIEGVNIVQKIKEPLFRFITTDDPLLSSQASDVLHIMYTEGYKEAKIVTPEVRSMGTKKLKENADDFAKKMYDVIKNVQMEDEISSYRETAKALNDKDVPSYRGEKWHINTLQQLKKRWKEPGLISDEPKKTIKPKPE